MTGYCEPEDVRTALQETSLSGPISTAIVEDEILAASTELRKKSGRHWYDSNSSASSVIETTDRSASTVRLDVPSSPHAQRDQIHRGRDDVRYPVTQDGPYSRIALPHGYVDSLNSLEIRDRAGDVTDWTSDPEYQEGRGEDYFVQNEDIEGYGRSYLYVRAASIGARYDYDGLVTAGYQYGLDEQTQSWQDVRRGVANLAAAAVVDDDDIQTLIPDSGQLVNVETQADRLQSRGMRLLKPYL
jgi:hypothetical protein